MSGYPVVVLCCFLRVMAGKCVYSRHAVLRNRLSNLYKTSQTSRKAFRLGKSVTYYKKLQSLVDNKSLTPWQRYLQYIQNTGMVRSARFVWRSV